MLLDVFFKKFTRILHLILSLILLPLCICIYIYACVYVYIYKENIYKYIFNTDDVSENPVRYTFSYSLNLTISWYFFHYCLGSACYHFSAGWLDCLHSMSSSSFLQLLTIYSLLNSQKNALRPKSHHILSFKVIQWLLNLLSMKTVCLQLFTRFCIT